MVEKALRNSHHHYTVSPFLLNVSVVTKNVDYRITK